MPGVGEGARVQGRDEGDRLAEAFGRCPEAGDTNSNAADFRLLPVPTPGAPNACP
jgi:hypothetical protein